MPLNAFQELNDQRWGETCTHTDIFTKNNQVWDQWFCFLIYPISIAYLVFFTPQLLMIVRPYLLFVPFILIPTFCCGFTNSFLYILPFFLLPIRLKDRQSDKCLLEKTSHKAVEEFKLSESNHLVCIADLPFGVDPIQDGCHN